MAKRFILKNEIEKARREKPEIEVLLDELTVDRVNEDGQKYQHTHPRRYIKLTPILLLDDELIEMSNTAPVEGARRILGADGYEQWTGNGGNAPLLWRIISGGNEEEADDALGESSPSSDS